ncbi:MAG TPA: hypothetical protein VG123_10065 [Streptosporangiaceae bacterium]|jgi:hypothetical protein|nr:hypothetical protein [Streptosporangiaceae bacterium]
MGEQPGNHTGRRPRARRWRTALLWVGALAALALAVWIETFGVFNPMSGP